MASQVQGASDLTATTVSDTVSTWWFLLHTTSSPHPTPLCVLLCKIRTHLYLLPAAHWLPGVQIDNKNTLLLLLCQATVIPNSYGKVTKFCS